MKVPGKPLLLFACVPLYFTFAARAQDGKVVSGGVGAAVVGGIGFGSSAAFGLPQTRTDGPYSAERQIETRQTLGDGTHVVTKSRSRFWRDSMGRTRTEIFAPELPGAPQEPTSIIINDPVESVNYYLTPSNRTGMRNFLHPIVPPPLQPPPNPPVVKPAPPPPRETLAQMQYEDLGIQMIEGVWARGNRQTITYPVNSQKATTGRSSW